MRQKTPERDQEDKKTEQGGGRRGGKGTDDDALEAGTSAFSPNTAQALSLVSLSQQHSPADLWPQLSMCVCSLESSGDKLRAKDRRYKTERVCG